MLRFNNEQLQAIEKLFIEEAEPSKVLLSILYKNLEERRNINWCEYCGKWQPGNEVNEEGRVCRTCLRGEWEEDENGTKEMQDDFFVLHFNASLDNFTFLVGKFSKGYGVSVG